MVPSGGATPNFAGSCIEFVSSGNTEKRGERELLDIDANKRKVDSEEIEESEDFGDYNSDRLIFIIASVLTLRLLCIVFFYCL